MAIPGPENRRMILRVCAALIRDERILMVRHREGERVYWTLPGGGVEDGESAERAAERELLEETGISARAGRALFDDGYRHGLCRCFLMTEDSSPSALLGHDPEESHLEPELRMLVGLDWLPLDSVREDRQVSRVLESLSGSSLNE